MIYTALCRLLSRDSDCFCQSMRGSHLQNAQADLAQASCICSLLLLSRPVKHLVPCSPSFIRLQYNSLCRVAPYDTATCEHTSYSAAAPRATELNICRATTFLLSSSCLTSTVCRHDGLSKVADGV